MRFTVTTLVPGGAKRVTQRDGSSVTETLTGPAERVDMEVTRVLALYPPEGYGTNVAHSVRDGLTKSVVMRRAATSCE